MIDIDKLQPSGQTVVVLPSDNIFHELGNNTYDLRDLISELVDNAIAARNPDLRLKVTIEFWVDSKAKCRTIIVRDNALGIPQDMLGLTSDVNNGHETSHAASSPA